MTASERPAGRGPGEASKSKMQTDDLTPPRTAQPDTYRAVRGMVCPKCRLVDAWLVQDPDLTTAIEHPGCYVQTLARRAA